MNYCHEKDKTSVVYKNDNKKVCALAKKSKFKKKYDKSVNKTVLKIPVCECSLTKIV